MLVNLKLLQTWTGYKSAAAIKKWLDENGVRYFSARNGEICTTEEAITARLIGNTDKKNKIQFK